MKKVFITILILLAVLLALPLCATATDAPEAVTSAAPAETDTAPAETVPTAEEIEQKVLDTINKIDWTLSGARLWEEIKAWVLNHLSTVVGAITVVMTLVLGLATKFSFIPKIIQAVKNLYEAIGKWYSENSGELRELRDKYETFIADLSKIIGTVAEQSEENNELRHALADALEENKQLVKRHEEVEAALLQAALLDAQQHQRLIQLSSLSCADLDAEYKDYKARVEVIKSLLKTEATPDTGADNTNGGTAA